MSDFLNQFEQEVDVEYRGEAYHVRDNGAVCRQQRPGQRKRRLDDVWTFGTTNNSDAYMHHGSEVVHRIVAAAFHGQAPTNEHIVDHIDTNRRNNRPENLRWMTRLDNVLQNPITMKRIILAYGSLEVFLDNPSAPQDASALRNYEWMRTVSKEEAQASLARLLKWAGSNEAPKGGSIGEWIYGDQTPKEPAMEVVPEKQSLTPMAIQRSWRVPTAFPMCPNSVGSGSLSQYADRLPFGTTFSENQFGKTPTVVAECGNGLMSVLTSMPGSGVKNWALAKVTIKNGKYVHEPVRTYFTLRGALKEHCELLGEPLDDSIDDYC